MKKLMMIRSAREFFKKSVIKHAVTHENYKSCLFAGETEWKTMNLIESHGHEVFSE
jgi:hypothetical protein